MNALVHLTQLFARAMVKRGNGYILNVSSGGAFLPTPYVAAYAASKAYVHTFSEAIRYEIKGSGVSITTLYPGITTSGFYEASHMSSPKILSMSILTAERVAHIGLRAMFNRRRAIVPGFINKLNAFFSHVLPRGMVVSMAGRLLRKS